MNYINLTNTDNRKVIINIDRIDCILSDAGRCKIYVGGSDYPIYVSNKINEILDMINKTSQQIDEPQQEKEKKPNE